MNHFCGKININLFRWFLSFFLSFFRSIFHFFCHTELSWGLRDVRVTVPLAVRRGDNAQLICNYDLENDTLYSVKWYKGRREFYRYLPKENPAMKLFAVAGITVDVSFAHIPYDIYIHTYFSYLLLLYRKVSSLFVSRFSDSHSVDW